MTGQGVARAAASPAAEKDLYTEQKKTDLKIKYIQKTIETNRFISKSPRSNGEDKTLIENVSRHLQFKIGAHLYLLYLTVINTDGYIIFYLFRDRNPSNKWLASCTN